MKTTLNAIREHSPCADGCQKLLEHLGKTKADDEPLLVSTIHASNGLDDALWALRAVDGFDCEKRLFAVWCARQVQHLMVDPRSIAALDVAERFANDEASAEELDAARVAARDAVWDAAWAARAARDAARNAAWDAVWDAARNAARDAQSKKFIELCAITESGESVPSAFWSVK